MSAQASPGKLIYDPFIGTGSMAYVSISRVSGPVDRNRIMIAPQTTAHFGAFVLGSDIDGRQMRGKGKLYETLPVFTSVPSVKSHARPVKTPGIIRAAAQYGVANRIMDLCTFDVTQNPWRCGELFDAIVTDPPCTLAIHLLLAIAHIV